MGLRINQNLLAMNAARNLSLTDAAFTKSLEKLSSGLRINRAADDAAGLSISEKLRGQVRGLNQAMRNAQDGISLLQTAEGGLASVHDMLQRMRELAVQAANDTATVDDRNAIQEELNQLRDQINWVADTTQFNTQNLLDGTFASGMSLQIGANAGQVISISIGAMDATTLQVESLDVSTTGGASTAIASIDAAIQTVSTERSKVGAYQNRLEYTIANLGVSSENIAASESRIRDVDVAQEMMSFTRNQILMQAGTAMLAQANAAPQTVLSLVR